MAFDRPFRLRVLDALTEALQKVTPDNDYAHDLSTSVFRGRNMFGDGDPLPMVSILEPPLPLDQVYTASGSDSTGDWDLLLQGFVEDDKLNPTDPAHLLLSDVKQRLAEEAVRKVDGTVHTDDVLGMGGGRGMGNEVVKMTIGPGVVRPSDEVSAKAYFWLTLSLQIEEDIRNPFN